MTERGGGEGKVINACGQTPGFPSLPHLSFLALAPFFKRAKHRESRSKVFLCFPTLRRFATQALCINYLDQLPRSLRKTSEHLLLLVISTQSQSRLCKSFRSELIRANIMHFQQQLTNCYFPLFVWVYLIHHLHNCKTLQSRYFELRKPECLLRLTPKV